MEKGLYSLDWLAGNLTEVVAGIVWSTGIFELRPRKVTFQSYAVPLSFVLYIITM